MPQEVAIKIKFTTNDTRIAGRKLLAICNMIERLSGVESVKPYSPGNSRKKKEEA